MTRPDPHPVELMALAALLLAEALLTVLRLLVVPAVAALLVLAGWRPGPRAAAPQAQPVGAASAEPLPAADAAEPAGPAEPLPQAPAVAMACAPEPVGLEPPPLERLTVAQLRRLARVAGLPRSLTRSGRRADLLLALSGLEAATCN